MLNDAILIGLVATVMQLIVKPLLLLVWPQEHALQDTITRAAVGVVAYLAVLANTAAAQPVTFAVAWSLLPQAGAVAGSAIAAYHILTSNVTVASGNYPPVELAPVRTLAERPQIAETSSESPTPPLAQT